MPTARATDVVRTVETFRGFVAGISCDYDLTDVEIARIQDWLCIHANLLDRYPYREIRILLDRILSDGVIDPDERAEILEWCQSFADPSDHPFDIVSNAIRRLHGFLQGMLCDGDVSECEVRDLSDWLRDYECIRDSWPFDDIWGGAERILEDGQITPEERHELQEFCKDFVEYAVDASHVHDSPSEEWMKSDAPILLTIDGVCANDPAIEFVDRTFCFTGHAASGPRRELQKTVQALGGIVAKSVTKDLDYLVIGALSQPAWAYATYGRKVERVLSIGKAGGKTLIIREMDFLRAAGVPVDTVSG